MLDNDDDLNPQFWGKLCSRGIAEILFFFLQIEKPLDPTGTTEMNSGIILEK